MLVRVPLKITLDGSVDIVLEEGETLESLSSEEIESRALDALEDDYEHYESTAEMTDTDVDSTGAYVIDDEDDEDEDYDSNNDFYDEDDEELEELLNELLED